MDKSRQQFEEEFIKRTALYASDIFKIDDNTGEYYFMAPRQAWYWWQTSRESFEVELPKLFENNTSYECGYLSAINDCEYILISNGLKVK